MAGLKKALCEILERAWIGSSLFLHFENKREVSWGSSPSKAACISASPGRWGVEIILGKFRKDLNWQRFIRPTHSKVISPTLDDPHNYIQDAFDVAAKEVFPDEIKALVWKFGEKGTDVNLASYLIRDVLARGLESALVITGDSDMRTPLEMCRDFHATIKLINPKGGRNSRELFESSDEFEELNLDQLRECQLLNPSYSKSGRIVTKPKLWD